MAGMSHATGVPAGWYPNAQGELQWWDGAAWGQLAPQPPAPQVTASASRVKSRTSPFVWWSFAASALGIVLAFVGAFSDGLAFFALIPASVALVLAVIGIVHSARKSTGVWALILAVLILLSPVLIVIVLALIWAGSGVFSQLTGGPVIG
mgnify:FL=1